MSDSRNIPLQRYDDGTPSVLRKKTVYTDLFFYRKSDVLVQLTKTFCERFLPRYGDRTVDQMVQAARSIKQNIAEGLTDGQTSFEVEIKLLGIAKGSNQELLEDYHDYLKQHGLTDWGASHSSDTSPSSGASHSSGASGSSGASHSSGARQVDDTSHSSGASYSSDTSHSRGARGARGARSARQAGGAGGAGQRFDKLLAYCRKHNDLADYEPFFYRWTDEEMCNTAICLCHIVDRAMTSFLEKRDREFVEEGASVSA